MEFSFIILSILFLLVLGLFAYCLTEPRGKNTVHARKKDCNVSHVNEALHNQKKDPISQTYRTPYSIKNRNTEAA